MKFLFSVFFFIVFVSFLAATIINIPEDYPTIQQGIDAAVNSDTVLVQPGTYFENIDFIGKNITVSSLFLTTQDTTYISQTIINGNLIGSVVTFENGEDSTAVLTGFTITNGFADYGGGIFCYESSPSLENVTITGNSSYYLGGGIYCYNCSPSLDNVTITDNSAEYGGGIYCGWYSSPSLENVTISGNSAYWGGGINCFSNSSPSLVNVTIKGNSAYYYGGGIRCNESSPNLVNVVITNNSADVGGGIYCYSNSSPILINSILWNDSPEEIYFEIDAYPDTITISYSDIQGGEAGIVTNNNGTLNWLEGNLNQDPLFLETGDHPFSLTELSPCIDTGIPDTTGLNLPPFDIMDNLRIWDGDGNGSEIIDMGAYEFGAPPYVDIDDNLIVQTPEVFLQQNYPNPFNPTTMISFSIPVESKVGLSIFNIKGQKVKTLVNEVLPLGEYSAIWDGRDSNGNLISSGIYFYKLKAGDFQRVRKMILIK